MGNKQTKPKPTPTPTPNTFACPTPPVAFARSNRTTVVTDPGINSRCVAKQVQFNQLQRDVQRKKREVETCNPQQTLQRKLREKRILIRKFLNQKRNERDITKKEFNENVVIADGLVKSAVHLNNQLVDLEKQLGSTRMHAEELEKQERTERRRFLDNDPQTGVSGLLSVRTKDDKILFAYYVSMGILVAAATMYLLQIYGPSINVTSFKQKLSIVLAALVVTYGISYYCIVYYA